MSALGSFLGSSQGGNIIGAVGGIASAFGQMGSAKAETNMGDYNAQILEQNAATTRQSQALSEIQKRKIAKSQIGAQVAIFANSGIKMHGSPLEVMLDSQANAEMDIAIDRYNSEVEARGYQNKAAVTRYEAAQKAKVGYAQAGSSFLSTAAGLFQSQQTLGGTKAVAGQGGYGSNTPAGTMNMGKYSTI